MLNITIIAIGKLKEQYLRDASAEYQKRLSASCKLNIIELTPEKLSDNPSAKEIENALNNEAKKIIEARMKAATDSLGINPIDLIFDPEAEVYD